MGSTSSHLLCGTNLTSLCWQIRQSSFGQQQSCTIQMLISNCSIVQWCLLLRFDWILPRVVLAKSDPHCLSVRDLLMAKIGNGNHSNLFHHGIFKCTDVLLDPSGFYGPITGWLLLCLFVCKWKFSWLTFLLHFSDFSHPRSYNGVSYSVGVADLTQTWQGFGITRWAKSGWNKYL